MKEKLKKIRISFFSLLLLLQLLNAASLTTFAEGDFKAEINGKSYATLKEAINDAESGDTIRVLQDLTEKKNFYIPSGILLDLCGHEVHISALALMSNSFLVDSVPGKGKIYGSIMYQTKYVTLGDNRFMTGGLENKGYVPVNNGDSYSLYNINYFLERFGDKSGNHLTTFSIRPYLLDDQGNYSNLTPLFQEGSGIRVKLQTSGKSDGSDIQLTAVLSDNYLALLAASTTATIQVTYKGLGAYDEVSIMPVIETDFLRIYGGAISYLP